MLTGSVAPSFAAMTAGAPLTAWYFNLFSPVGLVANLVVIPAGFLVVLLGAVSLLLGPLLPAAAAWMNIANAWVVAGLLHVIDLFSRVPWGWQYVMTPPLAAVVLAYALMAWISLAGRATRAWTATCAGCLLAYGLFVREGLSFRGVDLLDADDGQAALVQAPGFAALIDAGPRTGVVETLRALRREGIDRLDRLVLTHAAAAHTGGAVMVLRQLHPREIWLPSVLPAKTPSLDPVLRLARENGIPVRRLSAGESGDWPGGLHWRVLNPPAAEKPPRRAADASLVLHLSLGGHAVLIAGGAGEAAEAAVVARGQNAACDVLVAGNDEHAGACSEALLAFAVPRQVVLSGGAHLAVFHRGDDVRARVLGRRIGLLDLTLHGPVRVDLTTGRAAYVLPEPE
ncbi:MAG: ComEC/Rec2 family competence protein [Kiritimatiellia bacterium]